MAGTTEGQQDRTALGPVEFHGWRWFQRSGGNTYHTVLVVVGGIEVYRSPGIGYGYGDQWEVTAFRAYLEFIGETYVGPAWQYFRERNIVVRRNVTDVRTQREALAMSPFADEPFQDYHATKYPDARTEVLASIAERGNNGETGDVDASTGHVARLNLPNGAEVLRSLEDEDRDLINTYRVDVRSLVGFHLIETDSRGSVSVRSCASEAVAAAHFARIEAHYGGHL